MFRRRDGRTARQDETWRVRLHDPRSGDVLGSGVLLGGDTVLTCAHVLPDAAAEVTVEFPEIEGAAPCAARVREGGWIPPDGPDRGDLALLRLHRPLPERHSAPLLRAATPRGTRVEMCGYPASVARAQGAAFEATVSRTFGERVQLNPVRASHLPRHGFSGGPVLDLHEPSSVLGLTVTGYLDQDGPEPLVLAHMIPVDTVVKHLPAVERWTTGRRGVEPGIASRASASRPALDAGYAERLARWLRDAEGARGVYVTEVERGSARDLTLQRALALADRELSAPAPSALSADAPATVPPVGSLDAAVNVRGRTADEVAAHIAERLNLRRPGLGPRARLRAARLPLTLAFLGVDRAADPPALLELCGELADQGCRQLLVCHGGGARPGPAEEDDLDLRHRAGVLLHRIDELAGWLPGLTEDAGAGLADARPLGDTVARLSEELARLRRAHRAGAGVPPERVRQRLTALAARISAADAEAAATRRAAREHGRHREELREELESSRLLAAARLRGEDEGSAPEYWDAYEALYRRPFDPPAAARAVDGYAAAVRRALDWPSGEGAARGGGPPGGTGGGDAPAPGAVREAP